MVKNENVAWGLVAFLVIVMGADIITPLQAGTEHYTALVAVITSILGVRELQGDTVRPRQNNSPNVRTEKNNVEGEKE